MMVATGNGSMSSATTVIGTQHGMELYSIVLSTSMLCLAILFGTGGNVTILLSICTYKLLHRLQYILISMLLVISLVIDLVWCPMEIYHLIHHHHVNGVMDSTFTFAGPSLYIFVVTALMCILVIICFQNLCNTIQRFNCISRHIIGFIAAVISVTLILGLAIGYGFVSAYSNDNLDSATYHVLSYDSYLYRITVFSLWIAIALAMFTFLVIFRWKIKKKQEPDIGSDYSEPPTPEQLNVPTLLIKGTDDENEANEKDDENADDRSASNSQRFLGTQEASSTKEDNMSTIGDLPSPSRTKTNHLGVNMAAILGRRRHTIGQIGSTGLDVMEKAKQYNYIRKFSVDINALQAQLENPKIHGGNFPFRSDTELQKSTQNDAKSDLPKRPVTPLLDTRLGKTSENEENEKDISENDDNKTESDNKSDMDDGPNHIGEKRSSSHDTLSPPIITLSETTADDADLPEPLVDNRLMKGSNQLKLCCMLLVTFICCLLPMIITEVLHEYLSKNAYINILTCTMALSAIQTIIYPHILFCMDSNTHVSVHNFFVHLHGRVMHVCYGRQAVPTHDQNIDITVTQV